MIIKEDGSFSVQFLSGDLYDAASNAWSSVNIPFSSFNIGSFNGKIVVGVAQMEGSQIIGNKKVLKLDKVKIILSKFYLIFVY